MRHHHTGHAEFSRQIHHQLIDRCRCHRIKSSAWFVVEENFRIQRQGPSQTCSLLHATTDLRWKLLRRFPQRHKFKFNLDHHVDDRVVQIRVFFQNETDVVGDRHRIEQRPGLKQNAKAFLDIVEFGFGQSRQIFPKHLNHTLIGLQAPDHMPQQGRLATATTAHDDDDLSTIDFDVDTIEHSLIAKPLDQIPHTDHDIAHGVSSSDGGQTRCSWLGNSMLIMSNRVTHPRVGVLSRNRAVRRAAPC